MSATINWTQEKFNAFRKCYVDHRTAGMKDQDTFMFEGHELLMGYAKYLLQYLATKFNKE